MNSVYSPPDLTQPAPSEPRYQRTTLLKSKSGPSHLAGWSFVLVLVLLQLGLLRGGIARSLHGSTDFRAFYATGKLIALHRGQDIYNFGLQRTIQNTWIGHSGQTLPFLYPAFAALFFAPFSYLPFHYAFLAFATINVAILVGVTRWVARELRIQSTSASWAAYALTFGSISTAMALLQGQISFLLMCVFIGALELVRGKRDILAGIVLSFAFAKFQLAIPVFLLLCAWRRWRLVQGMICGAILLGGLSVMVGGTTAVVEYVHMMSGLTHATATDPVAAKARYGMFPSDMPNIHGLSYVLAMGRPASIVLTIVLSGLLMLWAAKKERGLPAALCVAMLVSYHFQAYDLVLLLVPAAVSLGRIIRAHASMPAPADVNQAWRRRTGLLLIACGLLVVPVGAAIVYSGLSWIFCAAIAAVLMSLSCQRSAAAVLD